MDRLQPPSGQNSVTPGDKAAQSAAASSRTWIYLAIAGGPVIGVFAAAILLATTSHRHTLEGLRLNGRSTYGIVEERHLSPGKHENTYQIDYRYEAYVPSYKAITTLQGEAGVSCGRYMQIQQGERLPVIYDAQQPIRSTLDIGGSFRRGMSEEAFRAWSASDLQGGPNCVPSF